MKLFVAAAVIALAKQASAYLVTQGHDGNYCVMVVKHDGTDWTVDSAGQITGLPSGSTVTTNGDDSATVAQNGLNDPVDAILTSTLQTAWDNWRALTAGNNDNSITIHEAGTTTPIDPQPDDPSALNANADLDWCDFYSTLAPDHYCKADGAVETWQVDTISSTATFSGCCASNHANMEAECFETSSGVVAPGSGDWYANYENNKCVRDCDPGNLFEPGAVTLHEFVSPRATTDTSYECGGLPSWDDVTKYSAVATCCSNVFTSLQPAYCEWLSTLGSASGAGDYPGSVGPTATVKTGAWYADTSKGICYQDCIPNTANAGVGSTGDATDGSTCGGTIKDKSVTLYDSVTACCSAAIPWDTTGCEARTPVGEGNPTNFYWAASEGCRYDCTSGVSCEAAPSSVKLYETAAECCKQANAWVNTEYCTSRAVQGAVVGSDQWYVDYEDGVCRKDCSATGGPCELAEHGSHQFFDSSDACCKATLAYVDQDACVAASGSGATISTVATNKWYVVSGGDQPCAKDCDTGSGSECGGVVAKTGIRLFESETECCKQSYSWVNQDLCEKLSLNTAAPHTDLWYVSYGSNACHQDCAVGSGPSCKGTPDDISIHMYDTAANCCKSKLNWMDSERCETASTTGVDPTDGDSPGTGEWRKNDSWSYCVLDCTAGETIATDDPILTIQPLSVLTPSVTLDDTSINLYPDQCDGVSGDSSASMYKADLSACCKSVNWVQAETCESLSTGEKTMMFFADPSDGKKCVVHQVADTSGTPAIQCAAGVVTQPSATDDDPDGVTCEPEIQTSTKLYSTLQKCCEANVPWDEDACFYNSKGAAAPGTLKYYVDWSKMKCVQDCPDTNAAPCGGLANSWDTTYASTTACCSRLTWVKRQDCVYTG